VRATPDPAALPALGGGSALAEPPRRAFVEQIMGLPISLHVRGPRARGPRVAEAVAGFFTDLRDDDRLFSTWRPASPVSRIRRGDLTLREAPPRVRAVAQLCDEANARTGGAFSAWLPGPDGEPRFDPTGLVKGWAVQGALTALERRLAGLGRYDALVNAGGDVAVVSSRTDTRDWTIAVENPRERHRTLLSVPLRRGAVATSGTAARGAHLIDPATGAPAREILSATVVGPDLTWADVYATAAFVRGRQALAWVSTLPGHAAIVVDHDGTVGSSSATPPGGCRAGTSPR
jgi:FAD:protein FMN transferase